jgi:hypothetical protein
VIDERLRQILIPICNGGQLVASTTDDDSFRVKRYGNYYLDVEQHELGTKLVMRPLEGRDRIRFWWYDGSGTPCFMAAVMNAAMWNPGVESDPLGWNENGQTGERRGTTSPKVWQTARSPHAIAALEADDSMWPDVPRGEENL